MPDFLKLEAIRLGFKMNIHHLALSSNTFTMTQTDEQVRSFLTGPCCGGAGTIVINMGFHEFLQKPSSIKEELRTRCACVRGKVAFNKYPFAIVKMYKDIGDKNLLDVMIDYYNEKPSPEEVRDFRERVNKSGYRAEFKDVLAYDDYKQRSDMFLSDHRFQGVLNRRPFESEYDDIKAEHHDCHWITAISPDK